MTLRKPRHVKFRREAGFGLVYDHENYGYEDATLASVDGVVVDVLERVEGGAVSRAQLEQEFSPATVEAMLQRGYLTDA
jgi:hypothetical protein